MIGQREWMLTPYTIKHAAIKLDAKMKSIKEKEHGRSNEACFHQTIDEGEQESNVVQH